jgi:hypothetical protein
VLQQYAQKQWEKLPPAHHCPSKLTRGGVISVQFIQQIQLLLIHAGLASGIREILQGLRQYGMDGRNKSGLE